ncbi:MAG: twin-arginine translocase TatA/TatE family subunit [Gammaproteobacteria bacterium]|jgi:sec-independent protein translocase protein TatA|nr:twin-arginine translocase TatA/TatE family subunit [Gammaproteobacteria bacterium]
MPFNISPGSLLLILVIVLVIFGTKKLRNVGSDLGGAVKGFRSAMNEADETAEQLGDETKDADFDSTPAEEPSKEKDA